MFEEDIKLLNDEIKMIREERENVSEYVSEILLEREGLLVAERDRLVEQSL